MGFKRTADIFWKETEEFLFLFLCRTEGRRQSNPFLLADERKIYYNWLISRIKGVITIARRKESEDAKRRILSACVKLFIEKGYKNTRMADILEMAEVSNSTFQNLFRSKDGVLMDLTEFMFDSQFSMARLMSNQQMTPVFVYALETSIQMALTELNENLREIYIYSYTMPKPSEYIFQRTSTELYKIFGSYLPDCSESDFYEMEIGTAGIMRGYMVKKCDKYFTLEKKLERFLSMSLCIYHVPREEREDVIRRVLAMDIRGIANDVMQELFRALAMKFEFTLTEGKGM